MQARARRAPGSADGAVSVRESHVSEAQGGTERRTGQESETSIGAPVDRCWSVRQYLKIYSEKNFINS